LHNNAAATEESTPPLSPTATFIFFFSIFKVCPLSRLSRFSPLKSEKCLILFFSGKQNKAKTGYRVQPSGIRLPDAQMIFFVTPTYSSERR
jgi:hypothetical protein